MKNIVKIVVGIIYSTLYVPVVNGKSTSPINFKVQTTKSVEGMQQCRIHMQETETPKSIPLHCVMEIIEISPIHYKPTYVTKPKHRKITKRWT